MYHPCLSAPRSRTGRLGLRFLCSVAGALTIAVLLLGGCGGDKNPLGPGDSTDPPGSGGTGGGGDPTDPPTPLECERPAGTGFQASTARMLADLAERAYEVDGRWQPGSTVSGSTDCWELVEFVERIDSSQSIDTQLLVTRNAYTNDLAVAFRGSKEGTDVWTDLSYAPVDWVLDNGTVVPESVHGGFARAYLAARERLLELILPHLTAHAGERVRVYFTGHSLGGALATLAALDLAEPLVRAGADRGDLILYTFGAPRSTTERLRSALMTSVPNAYAIALHRDWITHLPESILSGNEWVHLPQMALVHGEAGRARIELGDGARYDGCLGVPIPLSLAYHGVALYQQRLADLVETSSAPSVRLTVSGDGNMVLNWNVDVPGPCDWIGLFRGVPRDPDDHLGIFSWQWAVKGSPYKTWWAKGDDYYGAYVNGFDAIVTRSEAYVPKTPRVWISRYDGLLDRVQLNWSVSDPGENDFIALYDTPPMTAGPDGYLTLQWGWALNGTSHVTTTLWNSGYYIAYVMEDDENRRRILAWAGPN